MQGTSGQSVKVGIVGASGYTGAELLRLLINHPKTEVISITSRQYCGRKLTDVFPNFLKSKYESLVFDEFNPENISRKCDLVFSCLPHKASFAVVKELLKHRPSLKVIDFSADFRFKNAETYEKVYKVNHTAKELFKESAYGIPEINRKEISKKRLVANPGCYPTSIILPLYPLVQEKVIDSSYPIIADSKSGVSGAGRKEKLELSFCEVNESFKAYSVVGHRHQAEVEEKLGLEVKFTPHLIPINRGIISTIYFRPKVPFERLKEILKERYEKEPFIRLRNSPPKTSEVAYTNFCDIFLTLDENSGLAVVVSAIDNLGKGASSQAVQNMNVMFGFPETLGLNSVSPVV